MGAESQERDMGLVSPCGQPARCMGRKDAVARESSQEAHGDQLLEVQLAPTGEEPRGYGWTADSMGHKMWHL